MEDQVIPDRFDGNRFEKNRAHWEKTLDAQNLSEGHSAVPITTQLSLYKTADVKNALGHLRPLSGELVLDFGGGLGLMAILMAQEGASVIIADLSPARLKEAKRVISDLGFSSQISFVCALGESLPFRDHSFSRVTCKSVLIHTELSVATANLAEVLQPDGRAALIEPLARNPFVNLYRRFAAPQIWKEITSYFSKSSEAIVAQQFKPAGFTIENEHLYFLAFFATPLNYLVTWPRAYSFLESTLLTLDRILFALIPPLRDFCWFTVMKISPRAGEKIRG